ncbi:MAG: AAA family ATPase [Bacteroidota bacterium]
MEKALPNSDGLMAPLQSHIDALQKHFDAQALLEILTAQQWLVMASGRPIPKMLFSEFWFEGEFCMLFADTNLGKSILAVQLADSISKGAAIPGFHLQAAPQRVLYVDFELSDKQFEARYSDNFKDHYAFSEEFLRAELTSAPVGSEAAGQFETLLHNALEKAVVEHEARVLIIDNITYLSCETERAQHALPLMKQLKSLQRKYDLSILTLAHTPKRDLTRPLTRNDLQGSKMLINFCDSAFAIGESQQERRVRYLKQIKARNVELKYDSDQVCVCQIAKPSNFLQFQWHGFGAEFEHLRQQNEEERASKVQEVATLKATGLSNVAIAKKMNLTEGTVRYWLKSSDQEL